MATYSIANIRSALKTLLSSIASVQVVYDYQNSEIQGYPCVLFDLDNEDAQMLDDVNNTRILTFKLWIVCEIPNEGLVTAKNLLDSVTTDVVNTLEKIGNQTLSGNCDWLMPVVGKRDQINSPEGNYFFQELQLKVNVVSTIIPFHLLVWGLYAIIYTWLSKRHHKTQAWIPMLSPRKI